MCSVTSSTVGRRPLLTMILYLAKDVPETPKGQGEGTGGSGPGSRTQTGGLIGPGDQEPQRREGRGQGSSSGFLTLAPGQKSPESLSKAEAEHAPALRPSNSNPKCLPIEMNTCVHKTSTGTSPAMTLLLPEAWRRPGGSTAMWLGRARWAWGLGKLEECCLDMPQPRGVQPIEQCSGGSRSPTCAFPKIPSHSVWAILSFSICCLPPT